MRSGLTATSIISVLRHKTRGSASCVVRSAARQARCTNLSLNLPSILVIGSEIYDRKNGFSDYVILL
jgi:hypothetical protein